MPDARLSRQRAEAARSALGPWWLANRRDLPWRRRRDPYAIWVAEVMLQQTRVATVKDYYRRFLARFPSLRALAQADGSDVLKAWEGLGYYRRARDLHAAARQVLDEHDGRLPRSVQELRRLPGVGPYTAAAIASIAFGLDEPVLDGNVVRVLCRLFCVAADPARPAVRRKLLALAGMVVAPGQAGLYNQALMDLGATVCVPSRPRCDVCPLEAVCLARGRGRQGELPRKRARKPLPHYDVAAGVIRKGGRVLIDRRRPEGLLGGLWEFPGGKRLPGEGLAEALVREVREELGIEVQPLRPLVTVRHAYTHFRITLHVFECRHVAGRCRPLGCAAVQWVRIADLGRYAFPKANHAILSCLLSSAVPPRRRGS